MQIRLVQDCDYEQIASIREDTIRNVNSKDYDSDTIEDWVSQNDAQNLRARAHEYKRWVAVENDRLVGFCDHDFNGALTRLYVDKNSLGIGIGSALLKTAEESLLKSGCEVITIKSSVTAKSFYEKHGYVVIEKILDDGVEIYLMKK